MEHLDMCTCHAQVLLLNVDVGYPTPATPWLVINDHDRKQCWIKDAQAADSTHLHCQWHAGATNQHALLYIALEILLATPA
jgi:hypothetical protein